jgi:outer membrane protein insertion porin family
MAGPKDYQKQNALGGTTKLFGSVEYTFPIWSYNEKWMVRGALWMDMGDVWWKSRTYAQAYRLNDGSFVVGEDHRDNAGEINMSCGMGLRVITPIGPLRLDYGFPIVTDSESSDWDPMDGFSFNVGASF